MSSSSTKDSERSALLTPKQTDSDQISYRSFPGPTDVDAPDEEGPLLEEVSRPSLAAKHGITLLRGTFIVAALGVLVFLQGTFASYPVIKDSVVPRPHLKYSDPLSHHAECQNVFNITFIRVSIFL